MPIFAAKSVHEETWLYAVEVSAVAQPSPPSLRLSWPVDPFGGGTYLIYRKTKDASAWSGVYRTVPGTETFWDDPAPPSAGQAYEYKIEKQRTSSYTAYGYIYAGNQLPPVSDSRGKLVLIVENLYAASLATELDRLQKDLVGDGWTVIRHDVGRNDTPSSVKSLIVSAYNADPMNVRAVFLFGHVPIFRTGNLNVDYHQARPLPCDSYYGEVNSTWNTTLNYIPSDVELQVGRVDFYDLGCIQPGSSTPDCTSGCGGAGLSTPAEVDLLRNYLNKNHDYRHKKGAFANIPRRALVGDKFGISGHEAFAANGYRNFAPFFEYQNVFDANADNGSLQDPVWVSQRWISLLRANVYLWAYGCGGGDWDFANGLGLNGPDQYGSHWLKSSDLRGQAGQDAKSVFTMLFGSWFVEWDRRGPPGFQCYQGNPLRTMLATPTYGLAAVWAARPHHAYHHMGLGETIGYGIRLSQNNNGFLYQNQINQFTRGIHIALMGDPTLRLHPVAPPSILTGTPSGNTVNLTWTASADPPIHGYHVYRSPSPLGPFTRLTTSLVTGTSYSDVNAPSGSKTYMVRAVKLETSGSGTYFNLSQGICAAVGDPPAPGDTYWVDDAIPTGGVPAADGGDAWSWVSSNPTPFRGPVAHQSNISGQDHQHYFYGATATLTIDANDKLIAYVYLDPLPNMPNQIMLQWRSATADLWEHRAYWGQNLLGYGTDGTSSRRYMGPLPSAGQWVRLEVPASQVALANHILDGMAFTLYGGRATWDAAGKSSPLVSHQALIAHWRLDEASGTRPDAHGANHLSDVNTVGMAAGRLVNAASFDWPAAEALTIADNAALSMGDIDFTIAAWFYVTQADGSGDIVSKWNATTGQAEYALEYDSDSQDISFLVTSDGVTIANVITPSTGVQLNQWYLVMAWHDAAANTIHIQLDHGTAFSRAHSGGVFNGTAPFQLGQRADGWSQFGGRIDSVSIWKRVLTPAERLALYSSGNGLDYPFH